MKKEFSAIALTLRSTLSSIWNSISTPLSNEPRIWQKRDRLGNIWWYIYDPIGDRVFRFSSEPEVRQWLEKQFFHH
jgi:hypothetical protein